MAAVSSTPAQGALTPPSSPGQGNGSWDYAVPIDDDHGYTSPHSPSFNFREAYKTTSGSSQYQARPQQAYNEIQGDQRPQQEASRSRARNVASYESLNASNGQKSTLRPPKGTNMLGRKGSDISGFGSEPDSLLDLYGRTSADRSQVNSIIEDGRVNGDQHPNPEDTESSHWIHRDKLARIENEELQKAGIHIGRESRSQSRQADRRDKAKDRRSTSAKRRESSTRPNRDEKRRRVVSPIAPEGEEDESDPIQEQIYTEGPYYDPDGKDNAGATPGSMRPTSQKSASHSRIPLFKSSPAPVPTDYVGRNNPRARNGSGSFSVSDEPGIAYPKTRSRSQSVGSQALLDEAEDSGRRTPTSFGNKTPPASPAKNKQPVKPGHGTGPRKLSQSRVPTNPQKPRSRSVQNRDSPSTRPGTSSGPNTPGGSAKRPEGDPPWLATMYKPDPRLPPDQQLLPTVAKRLQQEQWEKEGKVGDVYDRNFDPISVLEHEFAEQERRVPEPPAPEPPSQPENEKQQWPTRDQSKGATTGKPANTSPIEHASYKTIPDLQRNHRVSQAADSRPAETTRFPDPPEDIQEKNKSCGCCIVM